MHGNSSLMWFRQMRRIVITNYSTGSNWRVSVGDVRVDIRTSKGASVPANLALQSIKPLVLDHMAIPESCGQI
jgi:hypothetical protein